MRKLFRKFKTFVDKKINDGHERTAKANKNILFSFLIKVSSIAISLAVVPLTLNYVDASQYGIWLTLSSIVAWASFFDIGITHGLRNKFAEAKASGNIVLAQTYISTTYAILAIIFVIVWMIFLMINPYLNWANLLNIGAVYGADVSVLAIIIFTYFCLQFVLRIITTVLSADQQPAKASLIDLIGQFMALVIVYVLVNTTDGSLVNLGLALCIAPIVALLGANIFLFKGEYEQFKPSIDAVKFKYGKDLFNLGVVFFVIQIAGLIQFQTANVIISRNFGPEDVTAYNIVYKYFNVLNMGFAIFLAPFWSASTEAFVKQDFKWIKDSVKKYNILTIIFIALGIVMLLISDFIYNLWLGEGVVEINFSLSLFGLIFFAVSIFGSKYVSFLNGISALRIQFWASIFSPFLYVGLTLLFINYFKMGVYSIFLASVIANFNAIIIAPIQYYMIVVKKKTGIWIR